MNKTVSVILALSVSIIMVAAVLIPVVNSASVNVGEPIEYTNAMDPAIPLHYDKLDNYVVELTATADDYSVIANGVSITKTSKGQPVIFSDVLTLNLSNNSAGRVGSVVLYSESDVILPVDVGTPKTIIVTFNKGDWSVNIDGVDTYSGAYSWVFGIKSDGAYIAHDPTFGYVKNVNKDIVISGYYDSDDLDAGYWSYYNGEVGISNSDYTGVLNYTTSKIDGTTDIYSIGGGTISISNGVDSNTFTPSRCLMKEVVIGHEEGVAGSLILILPMVVILSILVLAAYFVRSRY